MQKIIILILLTFLITTNVISQDSNYVNHDKVCFIDGNNINLTLRQINASVLVDNNSSIGKSILNIKKILRFPDNPCDVRILSNGNTAYACFDGVNDENPRPTIFLDKNYYQSMFYNIEDKNIAIAWILAHEFAHHLLFHTFKEKSDNIFEHYKQEMMADKLSGKALANLYPNKSFNDIENIIRSIITNNSHSKTHPSKEYRVLSVKAGFLNAILETVPDNVKEIQRNSSVFKLYSDSEGKRVICENGKFIFKTQNDGNSPYFECGYTNQTQPSSLPKLEGWGIEYSISERGISSIFFGGFKEGLRSGENCYKLWSDSSSYQGRYSEGYINGEGKSIPNWSKKDYYIGNHNSGALEGYGSFYYSNGEIYKGWWKQNKKHGKGILYKENQILLNGCWKEDVFQNNGECSD